MHIVSSSYGVTLIFQDADDLQRLIEQLQGMLEAHKQGMMDLPLTFSESDSRLEVDEVREHARWLKYIFAQETTNANPTPTSD